jgi:O-antigen ligase
MVLQFVYYALSGSRAATICYAIMLALVLVFYIFPKIKTKKGAFKSLVCILAIFFAFAIGERCLTIATQFVMKQTTYFISSLKNTDGANKGEIQEEIEFERVEDFESVDITNNRSSMWRAALKVIKQYPVFGVAYAEQIYTNTLWPDYSEEEFKNNIESFFKRNRRFGAEK